MDDAVLLAWVSLAVVLVAGGVAKTGPRALDADEFAALGVPRWLSGRPVVAALPWVEIVVGVALLVTPAPYAVGPAVLATLLAAAYLVVVLRVVLSGREAECACFGAFGSRRLDASAVLRNTLLLVAAFLSLADALRPASVPGHLGDLDGGGWAWVAGAILLALLVATVTGGGTSDVAEGIRGIPFLPVLLPDGASVSLPELASHRAQLLVTLSTTCSSCAKVTQVIGEWPAQVPQIEVRVLTAGQPGDPVPPQWPGVLRDPHQQISSVLGLARPSAVLLGADALIAGGPVHGTTAVLAFFEEVRDALDQTDQAQTDQPQIDQPQTDR